ncbi:hypothetical protein AB0M54_43320 [Actinoplanes sp. NPDC051470]|uniref:hypothetical protein n=1 Tax=unclassified Actinoplanes TaxID=2626549 RepID=UPI0034321FC9
MQRARRLASVAVAAALAIGGLSACRSEPDVAAYIGDRTISVADAQHVFDDLTAKKAAQPAAAGASGAPAPAPVSMPEVVSAMVTHDLVTRVAKAKNVRLPADVPLQEIGASIGVPGNAEYVRLYGESRLLLNSLLQAAQPGTPPDADVKHVFEVFEETGQMKPGLTYQEFKSSVSAEALQTLGRALNVKKDLQTEWDKADLKINPRFASGEIPVYAENGPDNKPLNLVSIPLVDQDDATVLNKS